VVTLPIDVAPLDIVVRLAGLAPAVSARAFASVIDTAPLGLQVTMPVRSLAELRVIAPPPVEVRPEVVIPVSAPDSVIAPALEAVSAPVMVPEPKFSVTPAPVEVAVNGPVLTVPSVRPPLLSAMVAAPPVPVR